MLSFCHRNAPQHAPHFWQLVTFNALPCMPAILRCAHCCATCHRQTTRVHVGVCCSSTAKRYNTPSAPLKYQGGAYTAPLLAYRHVATHPVCTTNISHTQCTHAPTGPASQSHARNAVQAAVQGRDQKPQAALTTEPERLLHQKKHSPPLRVCCQSTAAHAGHQWQQHPRLSPVPSAPSNGSGYQLVLARCTQTNTVIHAALTQPGTAHCSLAAAGHCSCCRSKHT